MQARCNGQLPSQMTGLAPPPSVVPPTVAHVPVRPNVPQHAGQPQALGIQPPGPAGPPPQFVAMGLPQTPAVFQGPPVMMSPNQPVPNPRFQFTTPPPPLPPQMGLATGGQLMMAAGGSGSGVQFCPPTCVPGQLLSQSERYSELFTLILDLSLNIFGFLIFVTYWKQFKTMSF